MTLTAAAAVFVAHVATTATRTTEKVSPHTYVSRAGAVSRAAEKKTRKKRPTRRANAYAPTRARTTRRASDARAKTCDSRAKTFAITRLGVRAWFSHATTVGQGGGGGVVCLDVVTNGSGDDARSYATFETVVPRSLAPMRPTRRAVPRRRHRRRSHTLTPGPPGRVCSNYGAA